MLNSVLDIYFARIFIFLFVFGQVSADDFDLREKHEDYDNTISLDTERRASSGILFMYEYPKTDDNVSFTLEFPKNYALVISLELLRLSKHCDAFVELANPSVSARYCRSTAFPNEAIDSMVIFDSPVYLNIWKTPLASSPLVELRYTVVQKPPCNNETAFFICDNGFCIWEKFLCDDHNNCGDGSDEVDKATRETCSKFLPRSWSAKSILVLMMVVLVPISTISLCIFAACISYKNLLKREDTYKYAG